LSYNGLIPPPDHCMTGVSIRKTPCDGTEASGRFGDGRVVAGANLSAERLG
jgi:hypothetical protein